MILSTLVIFYDINVRYNFRVSVILGVHDNVYGISCTSSVNETNFAKPLCSDPPVVVNVIDTVIHPDYDPRQFINDIAILQLEKRVNFTSKY